MIPAQLLLHGRRVTSEDMLTVVLDMVEVEEVEKEEEGGCDCSWLWSEI